MNKGIDFIHDFDPYDENHCFKEVKAKDDIVLHASGLEN
jgi:hypothetical protein